MGDHNSLSTYVDITLRLHRDIAERHPEGASDHKRDAIEIERRSRAEGISFLTKTLPGIGKAIDLALCGGCLTLPYLEKGEGQQLPKFLGVLLGKVFDKNTARCLGREADTNALRDLRTLAYLNYKLELPYAKETENSVLEAFVQTEEELVHHQFPPESAVILEYASHLLASVFAEFEPRDILPKHGPGAVATGEVGAEKFSFRRRYSSLEWYYPFGEYFFLNDKHRSDHSHWLNGSTKPEETGTAKVVLVPKDSRGPRIISCEPLEIQWIQQGLLARIVPLVESHPLTRGHVNFTCQEINRQLALRASRLEYDGTQAIHWNVSSKDPVTQMTQVRVKSHVPKRDVSWVTLDMKDASDRVSMSLVERLFSLTPLIGPLKAARSSVTILPGGRRVPLAKFAPMGSAVCFPVEALCFWALSVAVLVRVLGLSCREALKLVYVYGDDLITSSEFYATVMQHLEKVGLKFNPSKCCVSGFFRESCGCDAFNGADVTPIRLRKTWDHHGDQDAGQLVSYVAFSNAMHERGYWRVAEYVRKKVEDLYGSIPTVPYKVSVLEDIPSPTNLYAKSRIIGFHRPHEREGYRVPRPRSLRFNAQLQRTEIHGPIVEPVTKQYPINGWNELFRKFTCCPERVKPGVYAVPHRSRLKRGWGTL